MGLLIAIFVHFVVIMLMCCYYNDSNLLVETYLMVILVSYFAGSYLSLSVLRTAVIFCYKTGDLFCVVF